jgi:hypothetical protein
MSAIFVDTSSLVKYYYPENDSDRIETLLLKTRRIFISNLSVVEMASALMKRVRMGEMTKKDELSVWNVFLDDLQSSQFQMLVPDERHYGRAADIIRNLGAQHGIRTLDALQIAVAQSAGNVAFLCADKVLAATAAELGMKVVS